MKTISKPTIEFSENFSQSLEQSLEKGLRSLGSSLKKVKFLAEDILALSDYYINSDNKDSDFSTPWDKRECNRAYLSYYFTLNWLRLSSVIDEANRVGFFKALNIEHVLDFGAGPGVGVLAFNHFLNNPSVQPSNNPSPIANLINYDCIESANEPEKLYKSMDIKTNFFVHWHKTAEPVLDKINKNSLGVFSYSLNELVSLPDWFWQLDNLLIIDPSTQKNGRNLGTLRQELIDKGYYIWAPCLHQEKCPLLTHSKKDWCHDRLHWQQPKWFKKIEDQLPIKNNTISYSYLIASKTPPPDTVTEDSSQTNNQFRLTGDMLKEKGKSRVMVCRNSEREFMSWLKKTHKKIPDLKRGDIVETNDFEVKSNELRVLSNTQ